jgi:3-hydroxyisobutyrate dehydrogenase-like beta-hydroxyacid dehydrogenase
MGGAMAGFALAAGYPLIVCSRTAASRAKLVALGARETSSPAECAREADLVFSSIPNDATLRAVALGAEGVLANARSDAVFIDTSTVSVEVSVEVAREAERLGVGYLRLPISGNAASAQRGEVTALASGSPSTWERLKPVVQTFSNAQVYLGAGEEARVMKLVVNALVVNFAQAMAEALALGRKGGLDWSLMLDTLAQSTLTSPWLKAKAALLKRRDFAPTMTTRLILKDVDLMLAAARTNAVPMPLTAATRQLLQAVVGAGYGDEDYTAAVKVAEQLSGLPTGQVD